MEAGESGTASGARVRDQADDTVSLARCGSRMAARRRFATGRAGRRLRRRRRWRRRADRGEGAGPCGGALPDRRARDARSASSRWTLDFFRQALRRIEASRRPSDGLAGRRLRPDPGDDQSARPMDRSARWSGCAGWPRSAAPPSTDAGRRAAPRAEETALRDRGAAAVPGQPATTAIAGSPRCCGGRAGGSTTSGCCG